MRFVVLICCILFGLFACSIKLKPTPKEVVVEMPDINGLWQLLYINGIKVTKEQSGKELPQLEFKTTDNSLTGSTGCNRISGKIRVTPYLVDFENLAATRMLCTNALYETPMLQILRGSLSYTLENEELVFTKEGKQVMVFRRAL
ncbi:MAG: META domain-containing protein [Sediminibacterium sp.]